MKIPDTATARWSGLPSQEPPVLLAHAARQFATAVADGSHLLETTGYRVHIWPEPDPFYRNVAIPLDDRANDPSAIDGMIELFARHGRVPRLEFFAECHPLLAGTLRERGFLTDMEAPVMVRSTPAEGPQGGEWLAAGDDVDIYMMAAEASFGAVEPPAPMEIQRMRKRLADGRTLTVCLRDDCGTPVAGASLTGIGEVAELAAVWTCPRARRRGYACRVIRTLLPRFFDHGGRLVWLSAATGESLALYRGLGFATIGHQLNFHLPAGRH
ncbi:MAG: GNAT family N-acetyltransferase [Geminicoccaceae bacterium]